MFQSFDPRDNVGIHTGPMTSPVPWYMRDTANFRYGGRNRMADVKIMKEEIIDEF